MSIFCAGEDNDVLLEEGYIRVLLEEISAFHEDDITPWKMHRNEVRRG